MTTEFLASVFTSGMVCTLFWLWLNSELRRVNEKNYALEEEVKSLKKEISSMVSKEVHREHRQDVHEEISEIKADIKRLPQQIVDLLKPFLK